MNATLHGLLLSVSLSFRERLKCLASFAPIGLRVSESAGLSAKAHMLGTAKFYSAVQIRVIREICGQFFV